jgi:hypothetical protein
MPTAVFGTKRFIAPNEILASTVAFLSAFGVYEGLLFIASMTFQSDVADYAPAIVGRILAINAVAFIGLLVVNRLGVYSWSQGVSLPRLKDAVDIKAPSLSARGRDEQIRICLRHWVMRTTSPMSAVGQLPSSRTVSRTSAKGSKAVVRSSRRNDASAALREIQQETFSAGRLTSARGSDVQAPSFTRTKCGVPMQTAVAKVEWHPGELYPRVGFISPCAQ